MALDTTVAGTNNASPKVYTRQTTVGTGPLLPAAIAALLDPQTCNVGDILIINEGDPGAGNPIVPPQAAICCSMQPDGGGRTKHFWTEFTMGPTAPTNSQA